MHLGFVTSEYPHLRISRAAGIATSLKNLVDALVRRGVEVSIFVYHEKEDVVFTEDGIRFHLLKKRHYPILGWYRYRKHIAAYVNKFVRSDGIDAIEAPDWTGITAFMKLDAPLVIRFHGSDTYFCYLDGRVQKWKNKFFEKQAVKRAVAFIAPTTFAGQESAKLFGLPKDKVTTIHYGLNLADFRNEDPSEFTKYRLLNIGTIIRKKGVFQLAEMFSKLVAVEPRAELILIGSDSGDMKTGSESTWEVLQPHFSDEAKKRVKYVGKIPYGEVKQHIREAHVCVFPSLAETLGMVTIESMALQKVVVNTNYGWAEELIDHGVNGYKADPNDTDAYVKIITDLFSSEQKTLEIGKAARTKIEKVFDMEKIVQTNIEFYEQIISR